MKYNQRAGQYQSTTFFSISSDFKFKQILTFNKHKNLHIIQGQLVYNNGAIVTLSVSHQNLLQRTLNGQFNQSKQKIVFSIDSNRESLAYSGKIVDLPKGFCEVWANECQREVVSKKSKIVHFLAVIGFQIDCQNELMKRIIFQKRDLHQKLEELIGKGKGLKPNYTIQQIMVNENDESNVIFYGPNENLRIQIDKTSMIQGQKKVQGGYFSVQSQECILRNKNNQVQRVTLCRKTLRTEKKTQEYVRQTNQRKLKKQIQIVRSIKNKKYLLKYYCKRDLNNLQEILMQKCEYSLQEYINYFADSLEIKHKILIAQQIIQAVLILHAQGVVHRDIKPSNFLISDRSCRRDYYQLKIIDFAQSYSKNVDLYEGDYACSHPYSPLECSEFKPNSAQRLQQGIKNKEIDYWSVGMIIYQIFFRKLPLSFSRIFHHDIAASWKSELLLTVNERQKYGLAVVQDIVTILCIKMVKVEQTRRMKLETAMSILNILERYVNNLMKIAQEAQ